MKTRLNIFLLAAALLCAAMQACMRWDYDLPEDLTASAHGLFIVNEGNFQYGNATLSFYDPLTQQVENEVFIRANGFRLGDVAQSAVVRGSLCWIVVNHSHVVFAISAENFREVGRIENLPSPRYIHFVSADKAYVSQLWDNRIIIVDPKRFQITGAITVPGMTMESGSTEQMVQIGPYVYCNCWSYQNTIIKIDTRTDQVVASLQVGIQPQSLVVDCNGKLWTVTDGGYDDSPFGHEAPRLIRIDPDAMAVERQWDFPMGQTPRELQTNAAGSVLFWINDDVWQMPVTQTRLPGRPLIPTRGTIYYGLTVSPRDGDVYVADAIDYQQAGKIYRYSPQGALIDEFYAGIIPGAFAWK